MNEKKNVQEKINAIKFWWHTIELPNGIKTPGHVSEETHKWISGAIPEYLTGKTILDIATCDGYYSFLAEKRGAKRVLASDIYEGGFDIAREILNSKVDHIVMDVYDLDSLQESFDIVFCFGLYYHLKNPMLAFEKLSKKCKELLIVEGYIIDNKEPIMRFYEKDELNKDASNWWGASVECLIEMVRSCGFEKHDVYSIKNDRALIKFWK